MSGTSGVGLFGMNKVAKIRIARDKRRAAKRDRRMQDPKNPKRWLTAAEIQEFRRRLFEEQCGLCHWCKQPMRLLLPVPDKQNVGDVATFEHLNDRLSKGGRKGDEGTVVAACSKCNNDRNREREKLIQDALNTYCNGDVAMKKKLCQGKPIAKLIELLDSLGINPLKD
jgi:hypothetical protein